MCIPKGSDGRPGVLRFFCVAGVEQCALSKGRMYAPGVPVFPSLLHGRRGTIYTVTESDARPRDSVAVPGFPLLLRRRHGPVYAAKGSDAGPGVPLASLGLRLFCMGGVGQSAQGFGCTPSITH